MYDHSEGWNNPIICKLLIDTSKEFLKLVHNPIEGGRNNTYSYYMLPLVFKEGSKQYREIIWNALIYLAANKKHIDKIITIVLEYDYKNLDRIDNEFIKYDWKFIKSIIDKLDPNNITDCIVVSRVKERIDYFQVIDTSCLDIFLSNDMYKIYELLKGKRQLEHFDMEKEQEIKKQSIIEYVANGCPSNIMKIIDLCREIDKNVENEWSGLSEGLYIAFQSIMGKEKLYIKAVDYYLRKDTPLNLYPESLITKLFDYSSSDCVFDFINKYNYGFKTTWKYCFYSSIPQIKIENKHVSDWYEYLNEDFNLTSSSPRRLDFLKQYEKFDKNILPKSCEIILEKAKIKPFLIVVYFGSLFNEYLITPNELIKSFINHVSLLQNIYLETLKQKQNLDYEGSFFLALIKQDFNFVYQYVSLLMANENRNYDLERNTIKSIWLLDGYIEKIDLVVNYIFDNTVNVSYSFPQSELEILLSTDEEDLVSRQDEWITHYINEHNADTDRMRFLFGAISSYKSGRRKKHIVEFIKRNCAIEAFKNIPLELSSWGGVGSLVPCMQERIDFLESLMEDVVGVNYLEHKQFIANRISEWNRRIEEEQIEEMIRGY